MIATIPDVADCHLDEIARLIEEAQVLDHRDSGQRIRLTAIWDRVFELAYEQIRRRIQTILRYDYPRLGRGATSVANDLYLRLRQAFESGTKPATLKDYLNFAGHKTRQILFDTIAKLNRQTPPVQSETESTLDPAALAMWTEFHQAVDQLPGTEQAIFVMHVYYGLFFAQIARIFDMHEKTAARRYQAAVETLGEKVLPLRK